MKHFVLLYGLSVLAISLTITATQAETVSEDILRTEYESCLVNAKAGLQSLAEPYCTCVTDRIREDFTLKQYLQLTAEILEVASKNNGDLKSAIQLPRIQALAGKCLREVTS